MSEPPEFIFPPGARFSCNSCGKCCSSGFEIPVTPGKANLIEQSSTHKRLVRDNYQPLAVVNGNSHILNSDQSGRCHYLRENLCSLHQVEGLSHKPVICQLYPYNLVRTPDGVHVSLLYSCPSVVSGDGALLKKSREALIALFRSHKGQVPQLGPVREHILVTQRSTVTWQQYLKLEKNLLEHLNRQDPISYLLKAASRLALPRPHRAQFGSNTKKLDDLLMGTFQGFASSIRDHLRGQEQQTLLPLLKPKGSFLKDIITRFLQNQFQGKLLIIGPTMVCRLILLASGLALLLEQLQKHKAPSLAQIQEGFAYLEERLVSQSNQFESGLLEFEDLLLDLP